MEQWLARYRWLLFLGIVGVALTAVIFIQVLKPSPQPVILSTATPTPAQLATPTPYTLHVYVTGAIQRPDVYLLPEGSIVKDAVEAAGGATEEADLERINLALPVTDGQQVHVPRIGEDSSPVQPPSGQPATSRVNINTADAATLESLPGIGPALAQRIVEYRQAHGPFERIEDVMDVSGIGTATFEGIQDLLVVR
ncbi:MAG: ComEA family DNA-binding protein [Anaerolineae bacterium]